MRIWIIVSLLASQLAASAFAGRVGDSGSLKALCDNEQVKLSTIEDLHHLSDELTKPDHGCSDRVQMAIRQLKLIVANKDVCTEQKATEITQFADNYLKDKQSDEEGSKLPKALANFAIAYGMKVSGACSRHMIKEFVPNVNERLAMLLTSYNFNRLTSYFVDESPVGLILGPIVKTGEIILPSDLMQVTPGMATKLGVHLSDTQGFDQLKELCNSVLQPLYEPVLLPLAHLIRAGFNNRKHYFSERREYFGRFWSVAVFMCETVKMISPTGDQSNELPSEQRATLVAELKEAATELDADKEDSNPGQRLELDDLSYRSGREGSGRYWARVRIGDDTYEKIYDKSVKSLVKSFDANKGEVERLQDRIRARSFSLIFRLVRKKSFKPAFEKLLRTLKVIGSDGDEDKELEAAKETMLKLMDSPRKNWLGFTIMSGIWQVVFKVVLITAVVIYLSCGGFIIEIAKMIRDLSGSPLLAGLSGPSGGGAPSALGTTTLLSTPI